MSDPNGHHPSEKECHAFAVELCRGNQQAIEFCNIFYRYVHAIDDLIDLKEDGRPTMSNEDILAIFADAALLYNCPFFYQNRQHLFPLIISVTNQYADSVSWERSPVNRRRAIADVLRCCGDEVLFLVAMICGGWRHMRQMSQKIRERDFELQHTADDKPN